MFRRLGPLGLVAIGVFTVACSDTRETAPTAPQAQLTGLPCNPSEVVKLARSLLGSTSTGVDLARQLTTDQTTNIPILFQLFAEVAALADAAALPGATPLTAQQLADAANLTVQGIACGDVLVSDADYSGSAADVVKFQNALGLTGAYEVRGLDDADTDILSHNAGTNTTGASGVRGPFKDWFGGQVLFYGMPKNTRNSDEAQALPDAVVAFDWFTVKPSHPSEEPQDLSGIVAICINRPTLPNAAQFRIQQEGTILPINSSFDICTTSPAPTLGFRPAEPWSPLGSLAWIGRTFLAPTPLHATSLLITISPGGTPKKFSPHEVINPVSVNLSFLRQPRNTVVNHPVPGGSGNPPPDVAILATGAAGTPWQGVRVRILAFGNKSSLVDPGPLCNEADTDEFGVAHFPKLALQKPGGFRLVGITVPPLDDSDVTSFTPDSTPVSNLFNVKNSTLPTPSCQ